MAASLQLNKTRILNLLGGDEELFVSMAQIFLEEADTYCHDLEAALSAADPVALRRGAHTMKSLLASFADDEGSQLAQFLEQQAKAGSSETLPALREPVGQLTDRIRQLCAVLRQQPGVV